MSILVMHLEVKKWLPRPLLWLLWVVCFVSISLFFYRLCVDYLHLSQKALLQNNAAPSVLLEIVKPLSSWSIVLFSLFIPILTTNAFSQEFRHQTFTLWANSPLSARAIVVGKFLCILLFPLSLSLVELLMLSTLGFETKISPIWLLCSFFGILLITASITAFGLFISSITSNSLAAIIFTFIGTLGWMLLEWLNPFPKEWAQIAQHLSLLSHSYHLLNGIFLSTDFVYYLLFCTLWLSLAQHNINKKLKHYDNQN